MDKVPRAYIIIGLTCVRYEESMIQDTLDYFASICTGGIYDYNDCSTDHSVMIRENHPAVSTVIHGEAWEGDWRRAEIYNRASLLVDAQNDTPNGRWFVSFEVDERVEYDWDCFAHILPDVVMGKVKLLDYYTTGDLQIG